jgi:serine/threonine-protein kinase
VNEEPAWTPDSRSVSYISSAAGTSIVGDVLLQRADGGSRALRLVHIDRPISEDVWSPAGGWLAVRTTTSARGAGDILATRVDGDSTVTPILATSQSEYTPTISPDGHWLAYTSSESGRFEIYVAPFPNPGSARWQVSTTGGRSPLWSHRGGEIFYLDQQSRLVAARITTSESGVALQGSSVLFAAGEFVSTAISRRGYDVSADDQRFLMVRRAAGTSSLRLIVVENWFDEIRAKTGPR